MKIRKQTLALLAFNAIMWGLGFYLAHVMLSNGGY